VFLIYDFLLADTVSAFGSSDNRSNPAMSIMDVRRGYHVAPPGVCRVACWYGWLLFSRGIDRTASQRMTS
jgi:hypothetical protein